jgi:glycosyltransferase involved in cell wall biosynthesis
MPEHKKTFVSIKNLVRTANSSIHRILSSKKEKCRLTIYDDIFPHQLSAFRIAEFNAYLSNFPGTRVFSTGTAFRVIHEQRNFATVLQEYEQTFPQYKGQVSKFSSWQNYTSGIMYSVFINNAFKFINLAESYHTPFIFTLYPGGGFQLNDQKTDEKLLRVFSSPSFSKVIVTQNITKDYLLEKKLCVPSAIEFIYGVALPIDTLRLTKPKKFYGKDKDSFDICFVAHKYMPQGMDKGYPVFLEVARRLAKSHSDIFFHVVGSFDSSDMDVSDIADRIRFYGTQNTSFFSNFYSQMDMILSPNVPFVLAPNAFDGFPTGSSVEAGLCGVPIFCTDVLKQNTMFQDGKDIVIISTDINEICHIVDYYYQNSDSLYTMSHHARESLDRLFGFKAQIQPRIDLLSDFLA